MEMNNQISEWLSKFFLRSLGWVACLGATVLCFGIPAALAGVCDVAFGINVEGGLVGNPQNRIRKITTNGNKLLIDYYVTSNPTTLLRSELAFTGGLTANGVFDASQPVSAITSAVLNQLEVFQLSPPVETTTQRNIRFRAGNGASAVLNFVGPMFRFRATSIIYSAGDIGLDQVAAGAITGIWANYNFSAGVPSILVSLFSPNRNPQTRTERIDLVCPSVFAYQQNSAALTTASVRQGSSYVVQNTLSWIVGVTEDMSPISKYLVYRSTDRAQLGDLVSGEIAVPANRTQRMQFVDSNLRSPRQYFYRLRPILSDGSRPVPTLEDDYILSVTTQLTPAQRAAITLILGN